MRDDALGMFWNDEPVIKVTKEAIKRTPPERVWEVPGYIASTAELDDAIIMDGVDLMTNEDLINAYMNREVLVYDVECYVNYFLVAFKSTVTGKVLTFEMTEHGRLDLQKLSWILTNFEIVGFNVLAYDNPVLAVALAGNDCKSLKLATNQIIVQQLRAQDVLKSFKVKKFKCNVIDLIEVCPLQANLKIYSGRLHAPRMQDLPFHPDTTLWDDQMAIVRYYCVNDLNNTELIYKKLQEQIDLRRAMTAEYVVDLRSKSDAQIAESVIAEELTKINGVRPIRPLIKPGTTFYYRVPDFLKFKSQTMNWVLDRVRTAVFVIDDKNGTVGLPEGLSGLVIPMGYSQYKMGIGGLHSMEECAAHVADSETILSDRDVTSYYPKIILNQMLYPQHLGTSFLRVYQTLVTRRVQAKRQGLKVEAATIKIVVNGSYGKLGSVWSILYAPDLLIQVTITGQLSLLMLIERLEMSGIPVISANTDGIIIKCPVSREAEMNKIVAQWELDTNFEMEETRYKAVYSRDINNYMAVKTDNKIKGKGFLANPWSSNDIVESMKKNPTNLICVEAVEALLTKGTPITETIRACRNVEKFVSVRTVNGGAVKDGKYLGKSIRWYYATEETGMIVYARSGNMVPRSEGARPLMDLPPQFPDNVNYEWYEAETISILENIGYLAKPIKEKSESTADSNDA